MAVKRRLLLLLLLPLLAGLVVPANTLASAPAYAADTPQAKVLYNDGNDDRYLMGGKWLLRQDPQGVGLSQGFQKQTSTDGWAETAVPNSWNATDESVESMKGGTAWYRKDFRLPSAAKQLEWIVRFESVNYRSQVWLNGRPIGKNTGAYLPFEFRLPKLKRNGVNRLVIRVNNQRYPTDFPPSGLSDTGVPTGGWWNYGGLLREVYLRKIDRVDLAQVTVQPRLSCASCNATVIYSVTARNYSSSPQKVTLTGRYGNKVVKLGTAVVAAKGARVFNAGLKIAKPKLWSPEDPYLYTANVKARVGKSSRTVAEYSLHSGIRSVRVSQDGHLLLNGRELNFRGFGIHEDSPQYGFAINNQIRDQIMAQAKEAGATLIRSHYPLHPYLQELADREGMLLWSEIPVYAIKTKYLKQVLVRRLAAKELKENIVVNGNHPSIAVWSIGNELSSRPGPVQGYYIHDAVKLAHKLDPTRPVALAVAAYPGAGCQQEYGPLDVIGINEYFGWYPGPSGQIADRTRLDQYLESVRACYPSKALVISEFGAEANRDGPVEEKGTFQFQQDFINYHLGVYESKPWLSGATYWALQEFRVRPGWDGGNPRPNPPIHQKGVITFQGVKKPAFFDIQKHYQATTQLLPAGQP